MEENKELFIRILEETGRLGIDKLLEWIENDTDFFTAPASTRFHGNFEGGLLKHSFAVYNNLLSDVDSIAGEDPDSLAIVSLLHDICKANFYKVSYRNTKNERGEWVKEPYYTVEDDFPYGHGEKSVYLISKFIKLTDDEAMAIRWHMGFSDDSFKAGSQNVGKAFDICPLALYLHIADLKATYIDKV